MLGKTHRIGGISVGLIGATLLLQEPYTPERIILPAIFFASSIVGSLYPDIDCPTSIISKKFRRTSKIMSALFEHRGITHAILIHILFLLAAIVTAKQFLNGFLLYIALYISLGFFTGVTSHILLDALTTMGVPLLYPFSKKKTSILKLRTGYCDKFVIPIIIIATVIYLVMN